MEEGWKCNFTNNTLGINRKFSSSWSWGQILKFEKQTSIGKILTPSLIF